MVYLNYYFSLVCFLQRGKHNSITHEEFICSSSSLLFDIIFHFHLFYREKRRTEEQESVKESRAENILNKLFNSMFLEAK